MISGFKEALGVQFTTDLAFEKTREFLERLVCPKSQNGAILFSICQMLSCYELQLFLYQQVNVRLYSLSPLLSFVFVELYSVFKQ